MLACLLFVVLSVLALPLAHSLLVPAKTHSRALKSMSSGGIRSYVVPRHSNLETDDNDGIPRHQATQHKELMERNMKQMIWIGSALLICSHPVAAIAAESADLAVISVVRPVLDVFVDLLSFLMLVRTILSWYPKTDIKQFPYSLAVWPTEPLLEPTRELIPTQFGVDISAIVWIMLLSLVRELVTGQQGILSLMERNGM